MGWVLRDQLYYMESCGFDAFELKEGKPLESALEAFAEFSTTTRGPSTIADRSAAGAEPLSNQGRD